MTGKLFCQGDLNSGEWPPDVRAAPTGYPPGDMCRVCLKRPEIPDERYGRCEACAKAGRIPVRFRLGAARGGAGLTVRAGELSPRALRSKLQAQLASYSGQPSAKPHLGLHEIELVLAKDRLEQVRVAPDLKDRPAEVISALRSASERTEAAW
jgi:hypothetical protein